MARGTAHTFGFRNSSWVPVTVMVTVSPGLPSLAISGAKLSQLSGLARRVRMAVSQVVGTLQPKRIQVETSPSGSWHQGMEAALVAAVVCALQKNTSAQIPLIGGISPTGVVTQSQGIAQVLLAAQGELVVSAESASLASCRGGTYVVATIQEYLVSRWYPPENTVPLVQSLESLAIVHGHTGIKRILALAAVGGHPLYLQGPPGVGKSMLLAAYPCLLSSMPPIRCIAAAAHYQRQEPITHPPVHVVGVADSGKTWQCHAFGVLVCNELPLWREGSRAALRAYMDTYASGGLASQVIATANPCACGYRGTVQCGCTPAEIAAYDKRIPLPLRDRFPLSAWVGGGEYYAEENEDVRHQEAVELLRRVIQAREHAPDFPSEVVTYGEQVAGALSMSPRAFIAAQHVATSIAKLEVASRVTKGHVDEAISYRFR